MSWASGTDFIEWTFKLIHDMNKLSPEEKIDIWMKFIQKLEHDDCDTTGECLGKNHFYDEAYYRIHPDEKK